MRSTVASMSLTLKQRRLVAAVLVVVLSAGLLVTVQARPALAATCPCTIWSSTQTPATPADSDAVPVEVGVKFRADTDGSITGIRFYKAATNTGTHVGHLWNTAGANLGTVTFTGETGSGWQQASFATPVPITAGTTYVASYYAPNGHYAADTGYFTNNAVINGPLTALADGTDGGNGVYRYGSGGGFPNSSFQGSNYWVDVVYNTSAPDTTPPTVTGRTPADGAIGVAVSSVVSATFSESVQQSTISLTVTAGTTTVNGSLAYDDATRTATYTPSANLAGTTTYTVKLTGVRDTAGNQMVPDPVSWTFTTGSATGGCPCSIWAGNVTPATPAANDNSAVELGVKFRANQAGYVTGLRFYKGTGNTGTHVGSLWSSTGTKLASVTFSGETATGWQQATLGAPVAVSANTTYVASYYAPVGRYAALNNGFASAATTNGPLTALRNGTDGSNGVYKYGATGFPTSSYQSSNYYVDVVFALTAVDTTPPSVTAQVPAAGSSGVAVTTPVSATFSEPVTSASITMTLKDPGGVTVPTTFAYNAGTATLTPNSQLAYSTAYTATVSGAQDAAGNTMTQVTWTFTTGAQPPPPPDQGPGGPIAVVTSSANPYSKYLAEILRTEGLNEFATVDIGSLTATALNSYDVVVLGAVTPSADQVTALTTWVNGGGNLIALKPDGSLASLLGITTATGQVTDGYLKVDTSTSPGAGIVAATIQYHGPADRYTLSGATSIATLYSNATTATTNPAVTLRTVGTSGGQAAAFTYDLPRSIVLSRQGNPAWAGQERDSQAPIRSDDMYFGGSSTDWVNLDKAVIPQADEQQRLLANLVQTMNRDRKPLPRFWYFPNGNKAVVIATGDDHGNGGTAGRFDQYLANSPANCSVTNWTCPRFSSYVYPSTPLTNAQATSYTGQGFEVGVHVQNGCSDFTPSSLTNSYANDLSAWRTRFTSQPAPSSNRYHCIVYSDWASQPKTELANGMRLDGNYYYWPGLWVQNRPGFMTGSGMPMRFADTDGTMIDVYQAPSQMTDESDQVFPFTPDTLLDDAMDNSLGDRPGALGYYGAFNANMHTDSATTFQSDQLLASALAHNVPLVSGRQMITWLDGRNASSFGSVAWTANTLTFSVSVGTGANGLTGMLPTAGPGGTVLSALTRAGTNVTFTVGTIKGLEYASFPAATGSYTATYAVLAGTGGSGLRATAALAQLAAAPAVEIDKVGASAALDESGATAAVTWTTKKPATSEVAYGTSPDALTSTQVIGDTTRKHAVTLTGLARGTTYYYRVSSADPTGVRQTSPAPAAAPASFTTPADPPAATASDPVVTLLPDGTARVAWTTNVPTTAELRVGTTPAKLKKVKVDKKLNTGHEAVLTGLDPDSTYYIAATSTDATGRSVDSAVVTVVTPGPGVADQSWTSFERGTVTDQATIDTTGLGTVTLSGADGQKRAGTFTSGILDAQAMVDWDRVSIQADVPDGAKITVRVRTGSTSTPDGTWSSWKQVDDGKRVGGTGSRFIQYQVDLVAKAKGTAPMFRSIGFGNNGPQLTAPKETG